ncbi:peroxisomal membrane protein PEX14-like isoform X1 [Varroa destructor]|uniref:Peroxisomal membrane protein PEX14 n=2 Tax=Varroa destructor TaxID=109461 RepID=A0A7M7KZX8_VARDE|nr:peroxisomal membrane protein PEX14-like isoform X1 [Varroa destructor]XP_022668107.1 peroxisomal membrane protein PEX14-like isoform X1 [Varroa destructor]XP_022668108.1 peroxisomal membrane protein PEX14-like isoform X1 [Varroa destructor]XP_022668109.1 peroxisomal membrane protein PEX14-like isoform X1 [Varroa destructor]XP_022668110.1 peroxisomal membrane protein PEX14-like isoform X1 [Varroa destructor]
METSGEDQLEEHGRDIAIVNMRRPTGEPREDVVNTATAFLMNPRVQQSSVEKKHAFLVKKGLTPVEIEMAIARSLRAQQIPLESAAVPRSWLDTVGSTVMGVAVIGSAAYGLYWAFKTYIEPHLADSHPSSLERSVSELADAVRKLGEERRNAEFHADKKNARLYQLMIDLRQDVTSLKGVLVARSQFPVPPVTASIPSWQRTHTSSNGTGIRIVKSQVANGPSTTAMEPAMQKPVNGTINGETTEEDTNNKTNTMLQEPSMGCTNVGEHQEIVDQNDHHQQQEQLNLDEPVKFKDRKVDLEA